VDLLRVLDEKKVTRVGANEAIPIDFRLIAATNRNLESMVAQGTFREDLFYRLNVFSITLAPLRDRKEDIPPLAEHFLRKYSLAMNKRVTGISPEALELLMAHPLPGNAREIQNAIERAVLVTKGSTIQIADLPFHFQLGKPLSSSKALSAVEEQHIRRVLEETGWNISQAARLLEIDRVTLYHRINKYQWKPEGKQTKR
jgi:two-component system response regulator HydG